MFVFLVCTGLLSIFGKLRPLQFTRFQQAVRGYDSAAQARSQGVAWGGNATPEDFIAKFFLMSFFVLFIVFS